jgi:hypothetical protein
VGDVPQQSLGRGRPVASLPCILAVQAPKRGQKSRCWF